jgi:AraC-like DNA-binding protein
MQDALWSNMIIESRDPEEFVSMIRPDGCDVMVTERGPFEARGTLIAIGRLYAQRCYERLGRFIEVDTHRSGLVFLTTPGSRMFWGGAEIQYENLALFSSGNSYVSRLSGPTGWGSISIADNDMAAIRASFFGRNATWTNGCAVITPPPAALARLRSLHAAAGEMAERLPESPTCSVFAHRLEQAMIQAMLECVCVPEIRSGRAALQQHRIIIRRFREIQDADPLKLLGIAEISRAIGVPDRTLRMVCQEQFGVSPAQYLLLRRMRLARRALRQADPAVTSVTNIATEFGFWELGRFAVRYRQIFGETPSATLRAAGQPGRYPAPGPAATACPASAFSGAFFLTGAQNVAAAFSSPGEFNLPSRHSAECAVSQIGFPFSATDRTGVRSA